MSEDFRKQQKEKFIEYLTKATDENALCTLHNTPLSECDDALCEILTVPKDKHERFDLYAQDVNEWAWLQEFVPYCFYFLCWCYSRVRFIHTGKSVKQGLEVMRG